MDDKSGTESTEEESEMQRFQWAETSFSRMRTSVTAESIQAKYYNTSTPSMDIVMRLK